MLVIAKFLALEEQIYTLDGEIQLLAAKQHLVWFTHHHLPILQAHMLKQGKNVYAAIFKQLTDKLTPNTAATIFEPSTI